SSVERHYNDGRIVDIRIVRVVVLERPAAGTDRWPFLHPVAFHVQHLPWQQPLKTPLDSTRNFRAADIQQSVTHESRVPHRRDAWLTIGFLFLHHQKLRDGGACGGAFRMFRRMAQRIVHHHAVGHRRIDRTQSILAVQPLGDECYTGLDGALAHALWPQGLYELQDAVERPEERGPKPALVRRAARGWCMT